MQKFVLVGFAGSQGSGKSSLLDSVKLELELLGNSVVVIPHKFSRELQSELGADSLLDALGYSLQSKHAFQDKLLTKFAQYFERLTYFLEELAKGSVNISSLMNPPIKDFPYGKDVFILYERTYLDIAAYSALYEMQCSEEEHVDAPLMNQVEHSALEYMQRLSNSSLNIKSLMINVPPLPDTFWQEDKNRAPRETINFIDEYIKKALSVGNIQHHRLSSVKIDERTEECTSYILQG